MHGNTSILNDMVRGFLKLVDLMSASMGQERQGGRDERVSESEEAAIEPFEASDRGSASEAMPGRLAAFLAEAAKERTEASRPAGPKAPARVVRPHRVWPEGGPDPGPLPSPAGTAAETLALGEFPPEILWYQAVILPERRLGAGARQVVRWLEAKSESPRAKGVNEV